MNKIFRVFSGLAFCLTASYMVTSSMATAGFLYDSGPVDGQTNAPSISQGNAVSDQFTLTSAGNIGAIQFAAWVTAGDTLTSVDWVITTTPFGGDLANLTDGSFSVDPALVIAFGTAPSLTATNLIAANGQNFGFDVDKELFSGIFVPLTAGTYWLTLQNAVTFTPLAGPNSGDQVGWDENDHLSPQLLPSIFDTAILTTPGVYGTATQFGGSNTFQLISGTPEPGTVNTFLSGLLLVAGSALYKARRTANR